MFGLSKVIPILIYVNATFAGASTLSAVLADQRGPSRLVPPGVQRCRMGKIMTINSFLVVEDEPLILDLLESRVAEAGFQVVTVIDGMQATTELHADGTRFGAIIAGIRIGPVPDGWNVARRPGELVPNMPIVYVSSDSARDRRTRGISNNAFVPRRYTPNEIGSAVSNLLNKADFRPRYLSFGVEESAVRRAVVE
jgi:DNA-binding response OmpR family regulator